jgi:hypothetical protein
VLLLLVLALAAGGIGCGGGGTTPPPDGGCPAPPCEPGDGPSITLQGIVTYERLTVGPSPAGLGTLQVRPARHVDVEVRDVGGGPCRARTSTDALGRYAVTVQPVVGTALEIVVLSRTLEAGGYDILVHENDPPFVNAHAADDVFEHVSGSVAGTTDATVSLTVPYASGPANRPAIGFALLDTFVTCWDRVTGALGRTPPTLHGYTRVGNNAVLFGATFFLPGVDAIAVLGGAAGLLDASDTDYFDDAVVAHEFSHFVEHAISHSLSRGGPHTLAEAIEPNFAWSEGQATGFGCLLLEDPEYVDTVGTGGATQVDISAEAAWFANPVGIGGEFAVAEIVWDLGDGGSGPADGDADGIAVTLADLYAALDGFDPQADSPYVGLFLDRVVALSSALDAAALDAFLLGPPENQGIRYPLVGGDVWPKPIAPGGSGSGTLDSRTAFHTYPCTVQSATDWYRLDLAAPATVRVNLTITPIPGSGDDLDLVLLSNADVNDIRAVSANAGASAESIDVSLPEGVWLIRVEASCAGSGNRASYLLTVN